VGGPVRALCHLLKPLRDRAVRAEYRRRRLNLQPQTSPRKIFWRGAHVHFLGLAANTTNVSIPEVRMLAQNSRLRASASEPFKKARVRTSGVHELSACSYSPFIDSLDFLTVSVKVRGTQPEEMSSPSPSGADSVRDTRLVRVGPILLQNSLRRCQRAIIESEKPESRI
jgi:hypothetical protein